MNIKGHKYKNKSQADANECDKSEHLNILNKDEPLSDEKFD